MTKKIECYEAMRTIRQDGLFITEDNLTVRFVGTSANPHTQGVEVINGNNTIEHKGHHGSETIERALAKYRSKFTPA